MGMKMTLKGKFLDCKDYKKKDDTGKFTEEIVRQIAIYDGDNLLKIKNVDGSALKFGDVVSIDVMMYSSKEYGNSFVARVDN